MNRKVLNVSTAIALVLSQVGVPIGPIHSFVGTAAAQTATEEAPPPEAAAPEAAAPEAPASEAPAAEVEEVKKKKRKAEQPAAEASPPAAAPEAAPVVEAPAAPAPAAEAAAPEAPAAPVAEASEPKKKKRKAEQPAAEAPATATPAAPVAEAGETKKKKRKAEQPAAVAPAPVAAPEAPATEATAEPQSAPAAEAVPAPAEKTQTAEDIVKPKRKKPGTGETKAGDVAVAKEKPGKKVKPEGKPAPVDAGQAAATPEAAETVAAPSTDAPQAVPLAEAPIEQQIKNAAETPAAVIPDNTSKAQQQQLRAAEQTRRNKAKQNRSELIGAAAVGVAVGALIPLLGGKVVEDQGDRFVVERNGEYYVRKDESALFRGGDNRTTIEQLRGGRTRETIIRPNGSRIVTLRDPGGYVLRRVKVFPNGDEVVLFDTREEERRQRVDYDRSLPPIRIGIPRDEYIVSGGRYGRRQLADVFLAPPVEQVTTGYSLREVRESDRLRSIVRRVDLDGITFDTGSATVRNSQVPLLADTAGGMLDAVDENPQAVFLIEGHTDAVGSEVSNLTLSDRRAETVARILVDAYGVPAENLVVQGYGEEFLKIDTLEAERENRRVTIRNISPLLTTEAQ